MSETPDKETEEALALVRNRKGQYVRGVSGNPAGRPKGRSVLTKALTEIAEGFYPTEVELAESEGRDPRSRAELLAEVLFSKALKGDVAAAQLIYARVEGKPKASIESTVDVKVEGEVKHSPSKVAVLEGLKSLRRNLSSNDKRIESRDIVDAEVVEEDDPDPGFTQ